MGTTDNSTWGRIQQGVKETERLMSQRQYNLSMIRARQTLELMVNCLGEKALIVEGDLADSIDQLYEGRWISQATKDRYHRIRVIGNKAVHDGNDSAYDANEAYQTLVQEANAFANIYNNKRGSAAPRPQQQPRQGQAVRTTSQTSRPTTSRPTGSRPAASRSGGQRPPQRSGTRSPQRPSSSSNRSRRRAKQRGFDPYDLLKPAIILVAIILVVFIIVKLVPGKDKKAETTTAEITTEATTEALVPTEAPTIAPTTEAPKIYTTTTKLNVRSEPSTSSTVLGKLASDTVVEYVETVDSSWIMIKFEGIDAYVSSDYISITEETQEDESSGEEESTSESISPAA